MGIMKYFSWNNDKNELLKKEREVSFEDVVLAVEQGRLLDILEHPKQGAYPGQSILVVQIGEYAYLVPCVEGDHDVFLKTVIHSRKATKTYLK